MKARRKFEYRRSHDSPLLPPPPDSWTLLLQLLWLRLRLRLLYEASIRSDML